MDIASAQALQDTYTLGLMTGDADLMASVYAPGAVVVPPDGVPVLGRDRIRRLWQELVSDGGMGNAPITEELEVSGDLMIERGVFARFGDPVAVGPPVVRGRFEILHERQPDGRWLWAHDLLVADDGYPRPSPRISLPRLG